MFYHCGRVPLKMFLNSYMTSTKATLRQRKSKIDVAEKKKFFRRCHVCFFVSKMYVALSCKLVVAEKCYCINHVFTFFVGLDFRIIQNRPLSLITDALDLK